MITICCNRTAHRQHCLPAGVEARELNLKYARATGELNLGPFASAAKCVITRPPMPLYDSHLARLVLPPAIYHQSNNAYEL